MAETTLTITRKAQILADVATAAEVLGLPPIAGITVPDDGDRVYLRFDRLADVAQWAQWLEAPLDELTHGAYVHHVAEGETYGLKVQLLAVELISEPVRVPETQHLQAVR